MFESIIRDALVHHLESKCLINDSQHGFRKGRSCLTNQLTFLDFAKAFDKVPHYRLAMKLASHGIGGKVHDWLVEWTVPKSLSTWFIVKLAGRSQWSAARLSSGTYFVLDLY